MDKKLKTKWVKALESGRYPQTQNSLRDYTGYCCLGVLLTVSRKGKWYGDSYRIGDGDDEICLDTELDKVRKDFGITKKEETAMIRLNDNKGADFKEIAAYIKKRL